MSVEPACGRGRFRAVTDVMMILPRKRRRPNPCYGSGMTWVFYVAAAVAEIAGCFAFWAWARLDRSPLWLVPGMASLALFAFVLTRVDSDAAGRAYAAYGGVYIAASLLWLWVVEHRTPDRWDLTGAAVALVGAAIIILGPRPALGG